MGQNLTVNRAYFGQGGFGWLLEGYQPVAIILLHLKEDLAQRAVEIFGGRFLGFLFLKVLVRHTLVSF